jgi:ABC-type multidrug transport system ATPase subunit
VVILDEATAHLDSESEVAVQAALAEALEGRTAIVIAHRLSTVRAADEIAVVEEGRVVERGTHDDLLDAGGRYAALYRTQFAEPQFTGLQFTEPTAVDDVACPEPVPRVNAATEHRDGSQVACLVPGCDLVHVRAMGAEFPPPRGVEVSNANDCRIGRAR